MDCEIMGWCALHVFCKSHQICRAGLISAVLNYQGVSVPVCLLDTQRGRWILMLNCLTFSFPFIVVHHSCMFPGLDHGHTAHTWQDMRPGSPWVPSTTALSALRTSSPHASPDTDIFVISVSTRQCEGYVWDKEEKDRVITPGRNVYGHSWVAPICTWGFQAHASL